LIFGEFLMAAATERVVVLMPREEKARLESRARAAQVSIGEYVRRSVNAYDPDAAGQEQELMRLVGEVYRTHGEALQALDEAEAELKRTRSYFAAKEKGQSATGRRARSRSAKGA
jgi:hypothetical protein